MSRHVTNAFSPLSLNAAVPQRIAGPAAERAARFHPRKRPLGTLSVSLYQKE